MNKIQLLLSSVGVAVITTSALLVQKLNVSNPSFLAYRNEYSEKESEEIKGAMEYYKSIRANQITGEVDYRDVQAARAKMESMFNSSFKKNRAFNNMVWNESGPDNVGGRTRVVLADKTVANKLYMGAVGGGFWMSTDNGDSWTKRSGNDSSNAIAVASIAQAANGDIYYGTGEGQGGWAGSTGFLEQPFQLGEGIFKSTDGGATFNVLSSTKPSNSNNPTDQWSYVNKIVADPVNSDKLFAATFGGLKMTTNGGTTWAKPSTLTVSTHFIDLDMSTDGMKIAAATSSNLYISSDGGTTFSGNLMGIGGLPASGTASRIEIAIAPSDPNYIYVVVAAANSSLKGVYRSTDGGTNWTNIGPGGSSIFNPFGNQGNYDIAFGVHPTNKEMVFLGGQLELYRYTNVVGSNVWETIAYWAQSASSGKLVHADMHCIAFNPSNAENMYVTNDGGFYRTFNCSGVAPFFGEKNKHYSVTQCYGLAANRLGKIVFGTQDNGSGLIGEEANSKLESRDLTGGDGTRCAISDLAPGFVFTSVVQGALRRAADGGQGASSFKSFFDKNIDLNNGSSGGTPDGDPDEGGIWVSPINYAEKKVGANVKSIFLFGTSSSVWMTQTALKGNSVWFRLFNPGAVQFSALTMAKDGKTVFAGTTGGTVYRISVPNLWDSSYKYTDTVANVPSGTTYTYPLYSSCSATNIGSYGRFVTDLSCDSTGNVLVVTLGNYANTSYIYKTTHAIDSTTPIFTDITSNLPKMPVYSSLCLYGSPTKFMIGTEMGVWGTDNGGTSWTELNIMNPDPATWHPRVVTYELAQKEEYANVDVAGGGYQGAIIYSGTHGRGTFRSTSLASYFPTAVSYMDKETESIKVYPNPASDVTTVEYEATEASQLSIRIYSLSGSLVKQENRKAMIGKNLIPINISTLAQGGYIVYLNNEGKKASTTFIKK